MIFRLFRGQRGQALPIALILMALCVVTGITMLSTVDVQQRNVQRVKARESALQIAEGVLETQAFVLSSNWTQAASTPFPQCDSSMTQKPGCPTLAQLQNTFPASSYPGMSWTTNVYDDSSTEGGNAMQSFFSDALAANAPHYDADGDNQVWVKATATYQGKTRRLVALIKRQQNPAETYPFDSIVAGHFTTTNNGNKVIVNMQNDGSGAVGPVKLRCTDLHSTSCLNATVPSLGIGSGNGNKTDQLSPAASISAGYAGGNAMDDAAIGRLRQTAIDNGTHYDGCPANPSGKVVFIESGNCSYNNSVGTCCNSASSPGLLIINDGSVTFGGNIMFYGVVYAHNKSNSSADLVSVQGTAAIVGAVAVDGNGGITTGSSGASGFGGANIVFDANSTTSIFSYGTTGVVQNTWRELGG